MKQISLLLVIISLCTGCFRKHHMKPVVYLYPEDTIDVKVKVSYNGNFTVTYPEYANEWNVKAYPDGKLINKKDSLEYSYLFWEGESKTDDASNFATGFVVKGVDTHTFLREKLQDIGLTPKEYNEFIVFWYPILKENKYNYIRFRTGIEYDQISTMDIAPKPESQLRVFMDYKALDEAFQITPQTFPAFERKGFTVIEWGGGEIDQAIPVN